jgi:predicted nucleic acid-binding protein
MRYSNIATTMVGAAAAHRKANARGEQLPLDDSTSDATLALRQLEQLCAQALDIDGDVVPLRQAWETARTYRLSAYDSVYLDLALRARLPLATLEVVLRRAAGKAGVELLH